MRRAIALATAIIFAAGAAHAETWTKFADGENGTEWSYDSDYLYKDQKTGRLVVMQAISKASANFAPGGPGKGVGFVYAVDCRQKNLISLGSYTPSKPLDIPSRWRDETPKRASGAENVALLAAVCQHVDHAPVK
jgi:hypothetical protein